MIPGPTRFRPAIVLSLGLSLLSLNAQADVYDDVERMIRNGQYEQASQVSRQHLQKNPQDPQMRLLRSRILDARGEKVEATAALESLTQEFPELPEPHNNLAVLYAGQGRLQDALASLHKAVAARPDYAVALENLGDLYLSMALQAFQQARSSLGPSAGAAAKADALAPLLKR